jgi:hypothetical protein
MFKGLTWLKAGIVRPHVHEFTMENIMKNSHYYFRIFAENAIGMSEPLETEQAIEAKPAYSKYSACFKL